MWVRKSPLNLRSRTVYPGMKELVVLLTDYRKGPSPFSGNKPQELETQVAEYREKQRIQQHEYRRKQAEKRARNPQGLGEYREKQRIRLREYCRKQAEKQACNPQELAEYREKQRIRWREYCRKHAEKRTLCCHRRKYRGEQKRIKKSAIDGEKEQCDECGLCLVCGGYATASWGHKVDRCFEEKEWEETMSKVTSSVRSSMANELDDLLTLLSEEDEVSDSTEDSNLVADMERELNLSSEESSTETEEEETEQEEIKQVLNRKRCLRMQGVSHKVKRWMHKTTMSVVMNEVSDELDVIYREFMNLRRADAQFCHEDEVENAKDEYVCTLEVTGHLMNELEQGLL